MLLLLLLLLLRAMLVMLLLMSERVREIPARQCACMRIAVPRRNSRCFTAKASNEVTRDEFALSPYARFTVEVAVKMHDSFRGRAVSTESRWLGNSP